MLSSLSRAELTIGCYSKGCTNFTIEENKHGAIWTSNGKQYQWLEDKKGNIYAIEIKNAKKLKKITLYIGKDFDAYSKLYGKGFYSWRNGGRVVEFQNEKFYFTRNENSDE